MSNMSFPTVIGLISDAMLPMQSPSLQSSVGQLAALPGIQFTAVVNAYPTVNFDGVDRGLQDAFNEIPVENRHLRGNGVDKMVLLTFEEQDMSRQGYDVSRMPNYLLAQESEKKTSNQSTLKKSSGTKKVAAGWEIPGAISSTASTSDRTAPNPKKVSKSVKSNDTKESDNTEVKVLDMNNLFPQDRAFFDGKRLVPGLVRVSRGPPVVRFRKDQTLHFSQWYNMPDASLAEETPLHKAAARSESSTNTTEASVDVVSMASAIASEASVPASETSLLDSEASVNVSEAS